MNNAEQKLAHGNAPLSGDELNRRVKAALMAAEVGTYYWDIEADRLSGDRYFVSMFGVVADEHHCAPLAAFVAAIHPDDRERVSAHIRQTLESDAPYRIEYRVNHPDGERWLLVRGSTERDRAGRAVGWVGVAVDVTAQKRAEADARRTNERQHRLLSVAMAHAVIVTDREGSIVELMGGAEKITGYSAAEAIGRPLAMIFTPEDRASGRPAQEMATAERDGHALDKRWHLRKDGSRFFADGELVALRSEHGTLQGFGKVFQDITDRVRADEKLRASEEYLRRLFESSRDCIKTLDLNGRLQSVNEGGRQLLEMDSISSCRDAEWCAFWEGSDRASAERAVADALSGRTGSFGGYCPTFKGTPKWWDVQVTPITGADGRPEKLLVVSRDITAQKEVESNLARSLDAEAERTKLLRKVAVASRTVNSSHSADSIVRFVVADALATVGAAAGGIQFASDDLYGPALGAQSATGDVAAAERTELAALLARVVRTNEPVRLTREEFSDYLGAGSKISSEGGLLAVALTNHGGRNIGYFYLTGKRSGDFTAVDEAVLAQIAAVAAVGLQNARLYERLKEQDKRKDEFLALLAHELRNPLAPICNGLSVLGAAPVPPAILERVRAMMERQVGHLVHMVDDLLDVSRVTSGKIVLKSERLDLREIAEAAVETSRPVVDASAHELTVALPPEPVPVEGDRHRLVQVLTNLVTNAAKYTPAGGRIHVAVSRQEDRAVLAVTDNGVGLSHDMLGKVFDLFTQVGSSLERSQGGLGLGLTLARRLVEMQGGTIAAESPGEGRGSTFTVRLPLASAAAVVGPASEAAAPGPLRSRRVVVVDDNVDGSESLSILLEMSGHEVRIAHSGPDGLSVVREFRPELVLLDIGLPGMSGYDVARAIRAEPAIAGTTLVALTGWGTEDDKRLAVDAGFDRHLTKPVDFERVNEILAEKR